MPGGTASSMCQVGVTISRPSIGIGSNWDCEALTQSWSSKLASSVVSGGATPIAAAASCSTV